MKDDAIKDAVQRKYGEVARQFTEGNVGTSCCGSAECGCGAAPGGSYGVAEVADIPRAAVAASLGSGNPTAGARLQLGETVLDLGSGGGIDAFLAAKAVGLGGKVYGLDMTDEMLQLARTNQRQAGVQNIEFLRGEIENVPLPDESVDIVLSNYVINLSADKPRVLREAFRVLRRGGRFTVSDIIVRGNLPEEVRRDTERWVGCIAGALSEDEFRGYLEEAGFEDIAIRPTHVYRSTGTPTADDGSSSGCCQSTDPGGGEVVGAFIEARKP